MDRRSCRTNSITTHRCRSRRASITVWNLLALLVIVIGGLATLAAGQLFLQHWADSGIHVPVGGRFRVELPYGSTYIYYESSGDVPRRTPLLKVMDAYGVYIDVQPISDESHSFRTMIGGRSGRATHAIEIDEEGAYTVSCSAADYLSADDVPAGDRVSFFKQPNTVAEAQTIYKFILIAGASITIFLALVLYIVHYARLRRRVAAAKPH